MEYQEQDQDTIEESDYYDIILLMRRVGIQLKQMCRIPAGEFSMLLLLGRESEKSSELIPSDICRRMKLSRPAVSRMLHNLEEKGYLRKKNSAKDHRFITVEITESGYEIMHHELAQCREMVERVIRRMGRKKILELLRYSREFSNCLSEELQG